jgi:hypothetical protein
MDAITAQHSEVPSENAGARVVGTIDCCGNHRAIRQQQATLAISRDNESGPQGPDGLSRSRGD